MQTFLGGLYVNDFNRFGRTWQVLMQAEAEYRERACRYRAVLCPQSHGDMVPLGTLVTSERGGPEVIYRYNRIRAIEILGQAGAWL